MAAAAMKKGKTLSEDIKKTLGPDEKAEVSIGDRRQNFLVCSATCLRTAPLPAYALLRYLPTHCPLLTCDAPVLT
eukprot:1028482-Rhodomonas_salina.1